MNFNTDYFPAWLDQVREKLLEININGKHVGKQGRVYLFKSPLTLDENSWRDYFDSGLLPWQAVNEDLELPWIENKSYRIL